MFQLTEQQNEIKDRAREIAKKEFEPRAASIDISEAYPWDNVRALKEAGFMGMALPIEYGGQNASYLDIVLVIEEIARVCGVTARIVVEANMGAIGAIMCYGSEEQKKLASRLVLNGDKPAICITEPNAGSAATEMETVAIKQGDSYVLNGKKHWITGGGVSRLHLIFAKVQQKNKTMGIAGFIAVRDETEGLIIGKREPAMGLRGIPETEVSFENMKIHESMMLIPSTGLKRGFSGLMNAYNAQRVGAATVALGIAEGSYQLALSHSKTREQFGRPISEFQGLQWMLADMSTQIAMAQNMVYKAAASAKWGENIFPDMLLAAQAKILASEMSIKVTNDALQIFGAKGYSRNSPIERMCRDARMFTIGGGTAQVLRNLIASIILKQKNPQTRDGYLKLDISAPEQVSK